MRDIEIAFGQSFALSVSICRDSTRSRLPRRREGAFFHVVKAIELVQKAVSLGGRLSSARSRGLLRGDAIFIRVVRATTHLTERISAQPLPAPPTGNERTALTLAAAQLRFLGQTLTPGGVIDHDTPEGALAELVVSTLALVDTMLGDQREIAPKGSRALPALTAGSAHESHAEAVESDPHEA